MVSILNKLQVFWLSKIVKNNQTKYYFNKHFLPIKLELFEDKKKQKKEMLELKKKEKLLPLEIEAGIITDYSNEVLNYHIQKIEKKYYWKEKALIQTLKRKNIDDSSKIVQLKSKKNMSLKKITMKYKKESNEESMKIYQLEKTKIDSYFDSKIQDCKTKYNIKIEKTKTKINSKISKYDTRISKIKLKLDVLGIKSTSQIMDNDIILKLDKLSMYFGGLKAVDDLSFNVKKGEIFGLIGPNGAGKTTVFNCITRFYKPTSGDMYFRNNLNEVVHLNNIKVHNIIKEGIARTFQNVELIWELNVIDNLLVAAHTSYRSGFFGHLFNSRLLRQEEVVMRKKAEKILKDLNLYTYAYVYPYGLPYGVLKKIELARTLMINPKLIILDEPAAGLNDAETDNLSKTIKKIQKEYDATIFLVEHDMGLVMNICDTVCAISFGKKLAIGSPKEIQSSKVVQEAYLGGE